MSLFLRRITKQENSIYNTQYQNLQKEDLYKFLYSIKTQSYFYILTNHLVHVSKLYC